MTIEFRRMIRRGALAGLAPLLLLAVAQHARAADVAPLRGKRIVFVEPDRPGSVTDLPLALMRDEIARKAGAAVDIVAIGGRGGGSVLDYVLSPPAAIARDAIVLAVLDVVSRQLAESVGDRTRLLAALQPVATLSGALSSALVVADRSDIATIDDFLARARARSLRIVGLGRRTAFGIERAMLEKASGIAFADQPAATRAEILAALDAGEADAGFLVTFTLLPSAEAPAPAVRPILTFGAARNPSLPQVPTFKESVGKTTKGAEIASAVAVFAPRRTPRPVVAAMASLLREIAAEPAIKAATAARNYPLRVAPAATVREAMARVAGVIRQHREYLDR